MSSSDPRSPVHRLYEAFNDRDLRELDRILAPSFVDHTAGPGQPHGVLGIKEVWTEIWSAYPDVRIRVEDIFAAADRVAARVTLHAPATTGTVGRAIEIFHVSAGRIHALWNILSFTTDAA